MKKYQKYTAVFVAIIIVLTVGIVLAFSNNNKPTTSDRVDKANEGLLKTANDEKNPASEIGVGEFMIDEKNFPKEITEYKGVAMVDFFLPTCPHCQKIGPVISAIANETQGKYKIGKLNANTSPDMATKFSIQSVPAMIFFKNGKEVDRLIGAREKAEILAKLEEVSKK
ncbi:MAG: thioredoxin family protein [Patescibacteria group bacterium]|nr:thioredoxin family protein [Patescibacteria group bacterium]